MEISFLDRVVVSIALFAALQHVGIFVLEWFFWQKPVGLRVFKQNAENAARTVLLAKNQGVYNLFLAAGLFWGALIVSSGGVGYVEFSRSVFLFFFGCIVIAGIVGGATVNRRIFFVQGVPSIVGWIATYLNHVS